MTSLVGGLVGGLLLVELMLRVLPIGPQPVLAKRNLVPIDAGGSVDYHCYADDPHGEFAAPPDVSQGRWRLIDYSKHEYPLSALSDTPCCVEYRFEPVQFSRGIFKIRDRRYDAAPPAGVLRIALVGDSFVFGEGVPIERTLGRLLAAKLGDGHEVVNASQPGLYTAQEVVLTQFFAGEFGCRRAIVVFIANDIDPSQQLLDRQNLLTDLVNLRDERVGALRRQSWYAGPSRLASLIFSRDVLTRVTDQTVEWYLDCYDPAQNPVGLAQLADNFRQLAALDDCRVALVMYPLLEGLERDWPLAPIHQRVGQLAREAGLPVLDLAPTFAGQTTRDLWVHQTDHHPNGQANAIAAEAIYGWLRSDVPGFLDPAEGS
ncbi:MAG: SGNH/GDSL hydrolase family protein [Pirellulales bacterium]